MLVVVRVEPQQRRTLVQTNVIVMVPSKGSHHQLPKGAIMRAVGKAMAQSESVGPRETSGEYHPTERFSPDPSVPETLLRVEPGRTAHK